MGWTSSRARAGLLPRKAGASRGISAGRLGNGWCTGAGLAWLGHLGRRSRTGTRVAGPRGCGRLLVVELGAPGCASWVLMAGVLQ